MAATCIHGFAPGQCLICQTLDGGAAPSGAKSRAKPSRASTAESPPRRSRRDVDPARTPANLEPSGPRVVPPAITRSRFPASVWLIGGVLAAVAVVVVAWTVLHAVLAVLHILELVAAALLAGYIGWVAGVRHGRREARH